MCVSVRKVLLFFTNSFPHLREKKKCTEWKCNKIYLTIEQNGAHREIERQNQIKTIVCTSTVECDGGKKGIVNVENEMKFLNGIICFV